jgi:lysophospholipase L1-like esterase
VNNYPTLLSQQLDLVLEDQTCGGATTANVLGPWNELPAQIDAVTADTRVVTVTIGGNDLGYVMGLIGGSCRGGASLGSSQCFPNRAPSEGDYTHVEEQLRAIAAQVARRAPRATLVFVQYLRLVPPAPCDGARLPSDDAAKSRKIGQRLAEITARVARDSGSLLLPVDEMSLDHTACSAERWSVGMTRDQDPNKGVAPWHPTAAGHAAIARALASRLSR